MKLPESRWPTHRLTISVPIYVDETFDYNPLEEALRAILPITKLGVDGAICGDVTVSLMETLPPARPTP